MTDVLFSTKGKVSWFGGPNDHGVTASEGLAFIFDVETAPYLFLPEQPKGTTGLARRLDPDVYYVACRWDYAVTPKTMLASPTTALVKAGDRLLPAWPADWGPHADTKRVADISPGLMAALGVTTDCDVEVIYPYEPPAEEAVEPWDLRTPLGIFTPSRAAKKRKPVAKKTTKKAKQKARHK